MAQGGARTRQKGATVHSCQQDREMRERKENSEDVEMDNCDIIGRKTHLFTRRVLVGLAEVTTAVKVQTKTPVSPGSVLKRYLIPRWSESKPWSASC